MTEIPTSADNPFKVESENPNRFTVVDIFGEMHTIEVGGDCTFIDGAKAPLVVIDIGSANLFSALKLIAETDAYVVVVDPDAGTVSKQILETFASLDLEDIRDIEKSEGLNKIIKVIVRQDQLRLGNGVVTIKSHLRKFFQKLRNKDWRHRLIIVSATFDQVPEMEFADHVQCLFPSPNTRSLNPDELLPQALRRLRMGGTIRVMADDMHDTWGALGKEPEAALAGYEWTSRKRQSGSGQKSTIPSQEPTIYSPYHLAHIDWYRDHLYEKVGNGEVDDNDKG